MLVPVLHFSALICSGLFAGSALMETLVEHPSRLAAAKAAGLDVMQHVLRRADPYMPMLALSGFGAGTASFAFAGPVTDLLGGLLLAAIVPFTLIAIAPINRRILAAQSTDAETTDGTFGLMRRWHRLHSVRTVGGCLALALMALPAPT